MANDRSYAHTWLSKGLRSLFNRQQGHDGETARLDAFLVEAFEALRPDLPFEGMLVYAERRDGFELRKRLGEFSEVPAASLPSDCPSVEAVLRHRVYIFPDPHEEGSPWKDHILPPRPAAGVVVGRLPHRHILFFLMDGAWSHEEIDSSLNVLRAAVGLELLEERVRLSLRQAAEIQHSLLREGTASLAGFEIACRSIPAEDLSGDFYDFAHAGDDFLGLAVGDASGHGLPAALLVRDVVIGLRMGFEKHLRMEHVFSKLNRVIHRSHPSSRYISAVYGELEPSGNFSYVNAGHQPPLLFQPGRIQELREGGTVIGAFPRASYQRGYVQLLPGDVLVLLTDGVVEREGRNGELFGNDRLCKVVRDNPRGNARDLVDLIVDKTLAYGGGRPWDDDATVMVVRKLGK